MVLQLTFKNSGQEVDFLVQLRLAHLIVSLGALHKLWLDLWWLSVILAQHFIIILLVKVLLICSMYFIVVWIRLVTITLSYLQIVVLDQPVIFIESNSTTWFLHFGLSIACLLVQVCQADHLKGFVLLAWHCLLKRLMVLHVSISCH